MGRVFGDLWEFSFRTHSWRQLTASPPPAPLPLPHLLASPALSPSPRFGHASFAWNHRMSFACVCVWWPTHARRVVCDGRHAHRQGRRP